MRDIPINVMEARPLEMVSVTMAQNLRTGKFVPSEKRFRKSWNWHEAFTESALYKTAIDAGGGSTKGIISSVNVAKPQSQDHVHPFMEFSGVKIFGDQSGEGGV